MKRIDGIRATGVQKLSTTAENGDTVDITLHFNAATQIWAMDVEWNSFVLRGNRVYSSLNMMAQYDKIIPFGLGVITEGGGEPFLINDFSQKRVNLFLLSPAEVIKVQDFYTGLRDAG